MVRAGTSNATVAQIDEADEVLGGWLARCRTSSRRSARAVADDHRAELGIPPAVEPARWHLEGCPRQHARGVRADAAGRAVVSPPAGRLGVGAVPWPTVVIPIPGASPTSIEDSVLAADLELSEEEPEAGPQRTGMTIAGAPRRRVTLGRGEVLLPHVPPGPRASTPSPRPSPSRRSPRWCRRGRRARRRRRGRRESLLDDDTAVGQVHVTGDREPGRHVDDVGGHAVVPPERSADFSLGLGTALASPCSKASRRTP